MRLKIIDHVVFFQINGFLDKNRDTVMEEQLNILRASNNELLSDLFLDQGNKREILTKDQSVMWLEVISLSLKLIITLMHSNNYPCCDLRTNSSLSEQDEEGVSVRARRGRKEAEQENSTLYTAFRWLIRICPFVGLRSVESLLKWKEGASKLFILFVGGGVSKWNIQWRFMLFLRNHKHYASYHLFRPWLVW